MGACGSHRLVPGGCFIFGVVIMSNIELARRAIRHYNSDMVPKAINRANQRAWLASVRMLGNHWVLAIPQKRIQKS